MTCTVQNRTEKKKMKCKIVVVESLKKYNKAIHKQLEAGKLKEDEKAIVMTPETFAKVFSPERIKLLNRIYRNNIKNT